jgi:hypothetical protein
MSDVEISENDTGMQVTRVPAKDGTGAFIRINCGCCDRSLHIFPPIGEGDNSVEIGGVMATIAEWRTILGPLLGLMPNNSNS